MKELTTEFCLYCQDRDRVSLSPYSWVTSLSNLGLLGGRMIRFFWKEGIRMAVRLPEQNQDQGNSGICSWMPAQFFFGSHMFLKLTIWLIYKTTWGGTEGREKNWWEAFPGNRLTLSGVENVTVWGQIFRSLFSCVVWVPGVMLSQQNLRATAVPLGRKKALCMVQYGKESGRKSQPRRWKWAKDTKRFTRQGEDENKQRKDLQGQNVKDIFFTVL